MLADLEQNAFILNYLSSKRTKKNKKKKQPTAIICSLSFLTTIITLSKIENNNNIIMNNIQYWCHNTINDVVFSRYLTILQMSNKYQTLCLNYLTHSCVEQHRRHIICNAQCYFCFSSSRLIASVRSCQINRL